MFSGSKNVQSYEILGVGEASKNSLFEGMQTGMLNGNFKRIKISKLMMQTRSKPKSKSKRAKAVDQNGPIFGGCLFMALSIVEKIADVYPRDSGVLLCFQKPLKLLAKEFSKVNDCSSDLKEKATNLILKVDEILNIVDGTRVKLYSAAPSGANAGDDSKAGPNHDSNVQSLTPRLSLDGRGKYNMSAGNGNKNSLKSQREAMIKVLKRSKKAVKRELKLDGEFIELKRRQEISSITSAARAKRNKNYNWLQDEQATINQQVRKGKGLMKGGGNSAVKRAIARGVVPSKR